MRAKLRKLTDRRKWASGLFWSWNIIFLAFMALGFAPTLLPDMLTAVREGEFPANFIVYAIALTLIPLVTLIMGFTLLRHRPSHLFALGYGVEGPLMLLLALRFFIVRQMTPPVALLLAAAGWGILTYLWQLLDNNIDKRGPILTHLRLIGLTLLLVVGLYISVWLAFYALPVGALGLEFGGELLSDLWRSLITFDWRSINWSSIDWKMIPFVGLGTILGLYSATLFVLMPIAVSLLYVRAWWRGVVALVASYNRPRAVAFSAATVAVLVVGFIQTNQQPQHTAFALLETPPQTLTEARSLVAHEEEIRQGLLNAYLAPQRYISAIGEVTHVRKLYEWGLDLPQERAKQVQRWYEVVARPFLYAPVNPIDDKALRWDNRALLNEPTTAAALYDQFFDTSILEGERETIVAAVQSTWSIDQARANLWAVDDREVHLSEQALTITEQGDWATVELYEVYVNQTTTRQEVIYYFSLPETAVITGVWLGNSADRSQRFPYQVAPRGAAQATYRNEVQRRVDPALVEQIGPSQYRLRIFPIEPRGWMRRPTNNPDTLIRDMPPLHLWLTWQVMATEAGWPMPTLAQKRNVYWDEETVRQFNGAAWDVNGDTWLPATIPAATATTPVAHRVDLANGQTVTVQPRAAAVPFTPEAAMRLAVVLDRSRSMSRLTDGVQETLNEIKAWGVTADLYLTASPTHGEAPTRLPLATFDPSHIFYFGGQNGADLLAQFATLQQDTVYDAILVLTDGTGYETGAAEVDVPVPAAPVWMVHLDGRFPIGYDDGTLAAIQGSGGGVAGSLEAAMTRWSATREGTVADRVDNYLWTVQPTSALSVPGEDVVWHTTDDAFTAFAARRLIQAEMMAQRGQLNDLDTLDQLHALAIEHSIVTPYSSMIVLVMDRQQELLDRLSEEDDRFQREAEALGETTPETPVVTGVPEPEEWLLLGLAAALLIWYGVNNKQRVEAAV